MDLPQGQVESLRQEASDVLKLSRGLIDGADRLLSIGVIFLATVLTIAWKYQYGEAFLLTPPILSFMVSLQFHSFGNANALIVYRRTLEKQLNSKLDAEIYQWASNVEETRRTLKSWSLRLSILILYSLIILSIIGGYLVSSHLHLGWRITAIYSGGVLISLATVILATSEVLRSWRHAETALSIVAPKAEL